MSYRFSICISALLFITLSAYGVTGSGISSRTHLETVSPSLQSVAPSSEKALTATFSESMLAPGVTTPANYTIAGLGTGTLTSAPDTLVGGPSIFTLGWDAGEMRDGAPLTLTATDLQDSVGNLIAGNAAFCNGLGIAPIFTNVIISPTEARPGKTVQITFTVSEVLEGLPTVTVNGNEAELSGGTGNDYVYEYVVQEEDTLGVAAIVLSGIDLAGNMGTAEDAGTLRILPPGSEVPLRGWPWGVALLLLAGLLGLRSNGKRKRALLVVLALISVLVCSAAFAALPSVTNVTVVQGPNGTLGTKVDIYYDLVAPNGPCDISVSLSKDDGADGYSYPVTATAGDITAVETGTAKHILWDIRADYPEEDLPFARIRLTADDGVEQFTLTYLAAAGGAISGQVSQVVNNGAAGEAVEAVPETGYHFVDWSDGSTNNPRTDTNVTADITVTANFALNTYTLTYNAGLNGSITGDVSQSVNHGADGTEVTAVPDPYYHFVNWSDSSTDNPRTDTNVTADITVTANFAIDTYTLTYNADPNGSITGDTSQTVNRGSDGTEVTAVPDPYYHFVNWSDGGTDNPRTDLNVTADITVTANFAIDSYTLTYNAGPNGSITGDTPQTVNRGSDGTEVTAVPDPHYHFVDWSDGNTDNPRTDLNVTANLTVTANFAIDTHTLTYTAGPNGSISGDTPQTVNYGSDGTAVTAVADPHYHFSQWSDGSTDNPRTDINIIGDLSVEAVFEIDTFILEYLAAPGGSIDGPTPQIVDYGQDGALVTAVPDAGYRFGSWSDGYSSPGRIDTFNTQNLSTTAGFIKTWNLQYLAGEHGSLEGETSQVVDDGAAGSPVTAVADYGYHFSAWDDGSADNPRTDIGVTGDIAVTALFEINQYTLTYSAGLNGTITGDAVQIVEHGADGTAVEAVGDYGYHFLQWSDGITDNPRTDLAVTGDISVTAEFEINTYTLTYHVEDPALFYLTGPVSQTITHGGNAMSVGASVQPPVCYVFDHWSDGSLENPRQDLNVTGDIDVTAYFVRGAPAFDDWEIANGFVINNDEPTTESQDVVLDSAVYTYDDECLEYMASEDVNFGDAEWLPYATVLNFRLATQMYDATVYFKVRNGDDASALVSDVVSDTIYVEPMVTVPAGSFNMGRDYAWDSAWGTERTNELPVHEVYLDAYQIARHTVTTREYCDVLNWAYMEYWRTGGAGTLLYATLTTNDPYAGGSVVYAGAIGARYAILDISTNPHILVSGGGTAATDPIVFSPKTQSGYSMGTFPVAGVSWFGAAAYCNWLSRIKANTGLYPGFTGVFYNMNTVYWPPYASSDQRAFRLPTEAQWERAAAWDGAKHWIYGFTSDVAPTGNDWCSWRRPDAGYVNPFSLSAPYLSTPGWFDGVNVSPNGSVQTEYAVSPVGCYEMSGNIREWCYDWFATSYYSTGGSPWVNPTGPTSPSNVTTPQRVVRGGSGSDYYYNDRSAYRTVDTHDSTNIRNGFRVVRVSEEMP